MTAETFLRPLLLDDIASHAALLRAVEEVDATGEHYNEADLAEEYANPDVEIGKDVLGAFQQGPDGEQLVGYCSVYPRSGDDSLLKVHVEGAVRPDCRGRGVGTRLVAAMLDRAAQVHGERLPARPAHVALSGLSGNTAQAGLLQAAGFVAERYSFGMRAVLGSVPEPPPLPAGFHLEPFTPEWSDAMHEAHNAAFVDHPNFTPWTDVMWKQWVTESRNFRPGTTLLAVHDDAPRTVASYVQSNEYDAHLEATGRREAFVAKVGTRREHRGRGLAGAMLRHALHRYQQEGYDEAALDVDSENPTGALGIYERAGFEVESRWTDWSLVLPPVD